MAIAGLDVGTSGCKFVIYDLDGRTISSTRREYAELGTGGLREVDPNVVLENVLAAVEEGCRGCPEPVEGLAVTSMGESAVPVDEGGRVLLNSMVTGDSRGIGEAVELIDRFGKQEIMDITGVPCSEMYSLPKWLWIHQNTDVFRHTRYLFLYEDYVAWILTGKRGVSYSSASRTCAFDIGKKEWCEQLLNAVGLTTDILSPPLPSGTVVGEVLPEMAKKLGLPANAVVVTGGHDQTCATLGAGVKDLSTAEDGHGTCEVLSTMLPELMHTPYMMENELVCLPYVLPDTYLTYIVLPTCGILVNWIRDSIFPGMHEKYKAKGQNALAVLDGMVGPEPSDLLLLPQFGSAGIPDVDYNAKGLIWGLTVHTDPIEIYRATKESMSYHVLLAYERYAPLGIKNDKIRITGGGAASPLTMQMRSDIFNVVVEEPEGKECGTMGCMLLTGTALGHYKTLGDAIDRAVHIEKAYTPDPTMHQKYRERFERYKKLYDLMHAFK